MFSSLADSKNDNMSVGICQKVNLYFGYFSVCKKIILIPKKLVVIYKDLLEKNNMITLHSFIIVAPVCSVTTTSPMCLNGSRESFSFDYTLDALCW